MHRVLTNYIKEDRPWGNFERFTLNENSTVKIITVKANEAISLQTHKYRDEFWKVLSGSGIIVIDDKENSTQTGDDFFCPRLSKHRFIGGPTGMTVLEIAFGAFDEEDIERIDDRYGRN